MKEKNKSKQERGITLIALIITIVVLVVLSTVAINQINNTGLIGTALNAADDTKLKQIQEDISIAWSGLAMDYSMAKYNDSTLEKSSYYTAENLNKYLEGKGYVDEFEYSETEEMTLNYIASGGQVYEVVIDTEGKVTVYKAGTRAVLTLIAGDGTVEGKSQIRYIIREGETKSNLPEAQRYKYTFEGWYTESTGGEKVTEVSETKTLYAHYEGPYLGITFNGNGYENEQLANTTITVKSGQKIEEMPTVPETRTNEAGNEYDFQGWYTAADGGTQVTTDTEITEDMILYAKWDGPYANLALTAGEGITEVTGAGRYRVGEQLYINATVSNEPLIYTVWSYSTATAETEPTEGDERWHWAEPRRFTHWEYSDGTRYSSSQRKKVTIPDGGLTLIAQSGGDPSSDAKANEQVYTVVSGNISYPARVYGGYELIRNSSSWFTRSVDADHPYNNGGYQIITYNQNSGIVTFEYAVQQETMQGLYFTYFKNPSKPSYAANTEEHLEPIYLGVGESATVQVDSIDTRVYDWVNKE